MIRPLVVLTAALLVPSQCSPLDLPPIDFDFLEWWTQQQFPCPLWKGALPVGYSDLVGSSCSNIWTRTYTQGTTTARLYQVPGSWQSEDRYSEIVNGAGDAIKKGLATFGTLAGPLTINVGVTSGGLGDLVKVDDDNSGTKNPCYMLIDFPASWNDIPLAALQKDIIKRMYQCVEQFHKPTVTTWTEANKWWRLGAARYFDGLSYPAKTAFLTEGLYPEEYSFGVTLYQNEEAAALFFHYAQQHRGWTPTDVHNWVKGHANKATYEEERRSLSTDAKITPALWHGFILASIDGTIKYPGGQKITNTLGGPARRTYTDLVYPDVGRTYSKTVSISAFKGGSHVFPVKAGQTLRVSVGTEQGIEWSIRKAGPSSWNVGARGRTVDISVPAGAAVNYEIAVSSTRDDAGSFYGKVMMNRLS